ncbi:MAG TPA: Gfo/Idh/MocA family oxidoreductase [Nitrospirota bacterium]
MPKAAGSNVDMPRVAVIGAGYWGKNIVRTLHGIGALEAVCDPDERLLHSYMKTCQGTRLTQDYGEVLADKSIGAVAIATPAAMHADMVRKAIEAGKDVFVEKPLCLSAEEGRGLVKLAKDKGRVLMVGHLLHYHPAVIKLKELIGDGELGKIHYIYSTRLNLGKIRSEENVLWSFAPHDVSVVLALAGGMPDCISASAGCFLQGGLADTAAVSMSFKSGVKSNIFVSWLHPYKEQRLVVVGSKKMAVFSDTEPVDKLVVYPHEIGWKMGVPVLEKKDGEAVPLSGPEPLQAELMHFLECVRDRKAPLTDGEEGLRVLSVLARCQTEMDRPPHGEKQARPAAPEVKFFVHPTALVDVPVKVGDGTSVWHFSHIMRDCEIGKNCNIGQNVVISPGVKIGNCVKVQNNVSVYTGVTIEDGVFCGPSMVFTNVVNPRSHISRRSEYMPTLVKQGATIGANSTVVCGHTIGKFAFVGAGAVVTKDVPDYALVMGNPASVRGHMCECGVKLAFNKDKASCESCGAVYEMDGGTVRRNP